jgi:hypothetical protein
VFALRNISVEGFLGVISPILLGMRTCVFSRVVYGVDFVVQCMSNPLFFFLFVSRYSDIDEVGG